MIRHRKTLAQGIMLDSGTTVPAGTELRFSTENVAYYCGEVVDKTLIPAAAFESDNTMLDCSLIEAQETIDNLANQAIGGDSDALLQLTEIAKETSDAMNSMINEESCNKLAMEEAFKDTETDVLVTMKDSVDESIEKLVAAKESGDKVVIEDAVEQFRSILRK